MLDLFSSNRTVDERLEDLKLEIKSYQKKLGVDSKKTKVKLFYGDIKDFNTGIITVSNPPKAKFFDAPEDKILLNLLSSYGLEQSFLTYHYLILGTYTPKEIKEFGYYVRKLIDIINPKLIVCLGEESHFTFSKRKSLMIDFHGKVIGEYEGRPIMTTYPIVYYGEKSKFENDSYREEIKRKDWTTIKDKYMELV